jgi:hypothetical protein
MPAVAISGGLARVVQAGRVAVAATGRVIVQMIVQMIVLAIPLPGRRRVTSPVAYLQRAQIIPGIGRMATALAGSPAIGMATTSGASRVQG